MTRKVINKNNNISLKTIIENKLSIQFNLDGFSFSVYNTTSNKEVYFHSYEFKNSQATPENLLLKIKDIFKTDSQLQNDFLSVTVIHQNNLSVLVPNQFFSEKELASYLNFNIKKLAIDYIAFDTLEILDSKNIYVPYVNINNYLFQNFGEFEYKHHSTVLIEKLLKIKKTKEKKMFVNVSKSSLDITVIESGKLILFNTFSFDTTEDFIYYILFVAEQLNLNVNEFSLYFTGKIDLEDAIYKITYKYIKNIYFLASNNPILNKLNIATHSNFILLGS
jgi:mevalonate kinase